MYYIMYFIPITLLERGTVYVQGTTNHGCTRDYLGQCTEIVVNFNDAFTFRAWLSVVDTPLVLPIYKRLDHV